jgi:hypothetical protein
MISTRMVVPEAKTPTGRLGSPPVTLTTYIEIERWNVIYITYSTSNIL